MNQKHIAVVGCGYWGKNLVRNFYQLRVLNTICDVDRDVLRQNSTDYPDVRQTTDYDEVLDNEAIRGVVIATPAELHYEQAKKALLQGKDVFVEKPLALHHHQGQELVEIAEAQEQGAAILMVGHILEYHPAIVKLKEIVDSGELGRVYYIYSLRLNLGRVRREENILWSFAPHDISVILLLLGSLPVSVSAFGGSYLQPEIADITVTNLLFPDSVRAHIFVSWLHPYKEQKLVVIGDRKMAVFDDVVKERKLKIYDKRIEWINGLPLPRQTAETTLFFPEIEPLRLECEHFLQCIKDRAKPRTDGHKGLMVLKVLEASQRSLENNAVPISLQGLELSPND